VAQGVGPEFKPQYCKQKKCIWPGTMAQVVEHLPSKHKALSSNTSTTKKKKKKKCMTYKNIYVYMFIYLKQNVHETIANWTIRR
jgi:hypothetical protein